MNDSECIDLVNNLRAHPSEMEWFEFKLNGIDPQQIGEYLSALANSACLSEKSHGYLAFGISDATHEVVGTEFNPYTAKGRGSQELLHWLATGLNPSIRCEPRILEHPDGRIVLFEIDAAQNQPIRFKDKAFIRVGSSKTDLSRHPEKERALWRIFDRIPFEAGSAAERRSDLSVLELLDYQAYFNLVGIPSPENHERILANLASENLIVSDESGGWNVTNLGAALFARDLRDFPALRRKAMRVILYRGSGRTEAINERELTQGYAAGFEHLVGFIAGTLAALSNEVISQAIRRSVTKFPELAIRELIANALIHQDFDVNGAGPMLEVFDDRIEITNPGEPLIDVQRFLDNPPISRNENLASLMRRFGICEERGSGIDKVVLQIELHQLPAPLFEAPKGFTRVTIFSHRPLSGMDRSDRVRACYLHSCLKYVARDFLTNPSLRERFGIEQKNSAIVSRYIREAMDDGFIKPFDETASRRFMKYVPFWA